MSQFHRISLGAVLAGLLVPLVAASPARAARDLCIDVMDSGSPAYDLVLESFKLPRRGKCASFTGIANVAIGSSALTGAACASSDGLQVSFTITVGEAPSFGFFVGKLRWHTVILGTSDLLGRISTFEYAGSTVALNDARAYLCDNGVIP